MSRPGSRLRAFASRWCDERTLTLVVDPAVADLQREPSSRNYVAVMKVVLRCAAGEAMMPAHNWTSDDRQAVKRTLAASSIVMILVIIGLEAPFIPYAWREGVSDYRLPVYLVPQGLPMALAIGVTLGLLFGLEGRRPSRQVSRGLLGIALLASAVSFVDLAW